MQRAASVIFLVGAVSLVAIVLVGSWAPFEFQGPSLAEGWRQFTANFTEPIDLSHGRAVIRIAGPRAEWVLSKLFAVDFSVEAFPVSNGCSTSHHEIFAQIQRTGKNQFDVVVFRSFARAFFTTLCHSAEEVGYDVA